MNPDRKFQYKRILARAIEAGVPESDIAAVVLAIKDDPDCDPYTLTLQLDALVPGGRA